MSPFRFYIGTHASAGKPSIHHCSVDFQKGTFTTIDTLQEISDPTYLTSSDGIILYALGKASDGDRVFALSGQTILNSLPSGGSGPCHVCVDGRREFLLCANYVSGSVSLYDLNCDGSIHSLCDFRQYSGVGFDSGDRQKGPHAHYAAFHAERDEVLVCDLGLDMVYVYELDRSTGKFRDTDRSIRLPDGSGPRHLAFSPARPGMLFVLTEMANTIFTYRFDPDSQRYILQQQISAVYDAAVGSSPSDETLMLPPTADNGSIGCAIRFTRDGNYLFVSSRLGYQSISAFFCDPEGRLRFCSRCLCGGITPRDFNLFEEDVTLTDRSANNRLADSRSANCQLTDIRPANSQLTDSRPAEGTCRGWDPSENYVHLLVANQDSDLITALRFDRRSEELSLLDMKMQAVRPTCILPVRPDQ